ncbi:restriction endonuclease subunit S [Leptolyngbya sp. FACHB-321]|uniref:restriction endonuclease subunit S n=1 Tax=Leptolyngbya sp. FACHB-321 TaxID=2692807 RepID=UPI00168463A7|nr:restriction endonuclease subunit S [Leptolyngbya sp. FACHB-321]MBD2033900.1 restriction endonuclease subunit S [Leptolyngbya sp. FACHB-321]
MSEWEVTTLGKVCQKVMTGGTPLSNNEDFYKDGTIPWLRTKEVNFCRIRETESYISEQGLANSAAKVIPSNSVIIAMYGQGDTAGRVAINEIPLTTNQACCNLVIDERIADYNFVYFYLRNSYRELVNAKTGSAQPNLNTQIIKDFPITLPLLPEQKEISAVLISLDRKIENLRKQNETLARIAQTLFKHWFIDFEFPNEDGKPYKSSGGEMVRSELGEIPAGWSVGTSGNLICLQGGFAFKSQDFKESGNHRILKIKNISGNVVDIQQTDFIADSTAKRVDSKFKVKSGDVLIAMTGAEVAKMGLVPTTNEAIWLNQRVGLFREVIPGARVFIYCLFTRETHQQLLRDRGSGSSAQPNISGNDIESIPLVKPLQSVLAIFAEVVEPLIRKKCDNLQQIQTLAKTRDVLLPKLMSGKLRIKD